jgi:hypothetical protein
MVYYIGHKLLWEKRSINEYLDGDPHQVTLIDMSPEPGLSIAASKAHQFKLGRAVHSENVPTMLRWDSKIERLGDFEQPAGFPCISPKMKSVIEQFEPDVHQFFPLKVVNKAGDEIAQRWLWVVCNRIDSVDREHTSLFLKHGLTWRADGVEKPKLVFNQTQIGSCHFWRDKHLDDGNLLCSDEAGAALQAANLTALKLTHKVTV